MLTDQQRMLNSAIIAAALLVGTAVFRSLGARRNARRDVRRERASVIAMHEAVVETDDATRRETGNETETLYYVTFRLESGALLELRTSQMAYRKITLGETDLLEYRGQEFRAFGRSVLEGMKPLSRLPDEKTPPEEPASVPARAATLLKGLWYRLADCILDAEDAVKKLFGRFRKQNTEN